MDKNKKLIKYKLIDRDGYTRRGCSGKIYWLDGKKKTAYGSGNLLCSKDVIHYYSHPLLAVLFNPIHANIENPRLIEIEIDGQCAADGLKGGCKNARYIKEIELPKITCKQKVEFAIVISLKYYEEKKYRNWAQNWISGKDRTGRAARAAGNAAWPAGNAAMVAAIAAGSAARPAGSVANAAAIAAESAARAAEIVAWEATIAAGSAAWAAGSAAWAAGSVANAAARAAESAAIAAGSAARAAEIVAWEATIAAGSVANAAARAAGSAAWAAARAAGSAEKINKFFISTIRKIIKKENL